MQGFPRGHDDKRVVIIGGGPAGLTAAYELCKAGWKVLVLEKDNTVGGLARTVNYKGYHFDIGGHRFFTKVKLIEELWHEILGEDLLRCRRLSRIYYNKRFFFYPFRTSNALFGLGILNSLLILLSYLKAQLFPEKPEETFEQWVSNRFGKRLYRIFFKTYTEKVWGIPCNEIRAEWAAQRIKGLSLLTAIKNTLFAHKTSKNGEVIKTLIDSFYYPKLGPGMMWEKMAKRVEEMGGTVFLGADVQRIMLKDSRVSSVEVNLNGMIKTIGGTHFISSMPIRELIHKLEPSPPEEVTIAASNLKYRDFLTVVLIVNRKEVFPDNWIYIHDPEVKVGRVQNFKNWSPYMVPDQNKTCLGLEYFCFEGDSLWTMPDEELIKLGQKELEMLGLIHASEVEDGTVFRMPKAYPVYDSTYKESLSTIRRFLSNIENLQLVGRNGMHKYNNQDHSMLTAILAARNIMDANYDLWQVNEEKEYLEETVEGREQTDIKLLASTQPKVPTRITEKDKATIPDEIVVKAFAKLDNLAFAVALGLVTGLFFCVLNLILLIKGDKETIRIFQLINQYFIGYSVTPTGIAIGTLHSFLWGFMWGWLFAYVRNLLLAFFIYKARRKAESMSLKDFLDQI